MSSVPAWKRLGLKLKGPAPATAPNPQSSGNSRRPNGISFPSPAIKRSPPPASGPPQKKARYDPSQPPNGIARDNPTETPAPKKRKSVSFAPDTKLETSTPSAKWTPATTQRQRTVANGLVSPAAVPAKKSKPKKKKKKGPPKDLKVAPAPKLEPALSYLRSWNNDRDNWKFNKNHQTSLLRHVFSPPDPKSTTRDTIPAEDIPALLEYVRDLKGFVRSRLRETAEEVRKTDMAPYSSTHTGFPEATADVATRQAEYDDLIQTFLSQPTTPGLNNPRYSFSETEFYRTYPDTNTTVARRVVKRMRAEMVLEAIASDSDASEASSTSRATEASNQTRDNERSPADKRVKLNDGTLQRVKRKRKIRTAEIESDSSSDESTSSSSSSSSSESESENDADSESEEEEEAEADDEEDTSEASVSSKEETSSEEGSDEEVAGRINLRTEQHAEAEDSSSGDEDDDEEEEEEESSGSQSSSSSESGSDDEGAVAMDVELRENLETSPSSESSDDNDD